VFLLMAIAWKSQRRVMMLVTCTMVVLGGRGAGRGDDR
jgi:hypothetical protein